MPSRRRHKQSQHPWNKCAPWVPEGAQALVRGGVLGSTSECAGRGATPQMGCLCRRLGGFTLLEVLVSLSVVAVAVTVVLQLFSADLRAIAASEDYASAVVKAEAKMRGLLDNDDLAETSWSEATPDGYRMDVSIADVLKEKTNNLQVRLLEIGLTTRWFKGTKEKTLTLRTMKLVNKLALATTTPKAAAGAAVPGTGTSTAVAPGTAGSRVRGQ
jgi:prepilin-type N-terminal cleavage/methylation domain-containing protein